MKRLIIFGICIIALMFTSHSYSQVNFRGSLQSSIYGWENFNGNQQWDYYQGLQFRIAPENYSNLYFSTYLREAYRGDPADWEEKVYNLYANWDITRNYRVRVGRQFLYQGVMNGTVDAVLLSANPVKNLRISAMVGTEATLERTLKIRDWDNGNVLGGFLAYTLPCQRNSLEISYFQKERWDELYWQQAGAAFRGTVMNHLNYYLRYDHNLLKSEYQNLRFRLSYFTPKWTATAEFNSMKPMIYEDSFFNIFDIEAHNQIRTAGTYRLGNYELGLQYLFTVYEAHEFYILYKEDNDSRVIATVGNQWGTIGVIFQNGAGGNNIGYYGDIRYEFLPNLTANLYHSFYNYERATTNISEEALDFSAGLSYRLRNMLILSGEVQESSNSYYDSDWRGLFRLTYLFRN